ncbi:MAG: putative ATPase [Halonotius sp. J07HN6]|nr:MAG: putative ATPase [Halonotius sp. J07HN6]
MSNEETITVADVSAGPGGTDDIKSGTPVSLPVVDLLTGRGFITGKSGSGKSNTASVILENLLDNNFPVLIVDRDGEYYGLKEAYEILHVGADEECDIQVTADHAEKIASLALEENIPIILDVSGYLDSADADELVLETTRHLFAKEKKLKKPFMMIVEECHEYIPEQSGMDEVGKMLIKIGKRGRKHGLGIVGISQRPADVKKDFITQCDWLVWHRLTWRNDTKVVGRILGSEYADAVEELGDGEGFLVADWSADVRRVQFHRKKTFDAGATPGLDEIEQPELKSVSDDLVDELTEISEEKARRESELADLRQELDRKEARIQELERELEEARDLSRMADQFAQAMLQRSQASYRGGDDSPPDAAAGDTDATAGSAADDADTSTSETEATPATGGETDSPDTASPDTDGSVDPEALAEAVESADLDAEEMSALVPDEIPDPSGDQSGDDSDSDEYDQAVGVNPDPVDPSEVSGPTEVERTDTDDEESITKRFGTVTQSDIAEEAMEFAEAVQLGTRQAVVSELSSRIDDLPLLSVGMLRHYREERRASRFRPTSPPVATTTTSWPTAEIGHSGSHSSSAMSARAATRMRSPI